MTAPIVKWAGGKTKLLPELLKYIPSNYGTYYEPFAGGAALFFRLQPRHAVLGDMNADLMTTYEAIQKDVEDVIHRLLYYARAHKDNPEGFYYSVRETWNTHRWPAPGECAAAFIYLNRTCFNGLWRVNKKGDFNVPMGSYVDPPICMPDALRAAATTLRDTKLCVGSYIDTLADVQAGDLVYLDPPYDGTFNAYTSEGRFDQDKLAEVVDALVDGGVYVLVSNNDTPLIRQLYGKYRIEHVKCGRAINADSRKRGAVDEVIVIGMPPGSGTL